MSQEPHFGFDKPPILLMGSGITRRYADGAPDWIGLLRHISSRIGIDESRFIAFEEEARRTCDESVGHLPRLASILDGYLRNSIMDQSVRIQDVLDERELSHYNDMRGGAVKIMAASKFSNLSLKKDAQTASELAILRKLPDVIPCVITTNYDRIIENDLFEGKFKVYSRVSDYYLSSSQGIGEIFKIHGTCDDPSTIIT